MQAAIELESVVSAPAPPEMIKDQPSPESKAGIISKLFFLWPSPLFHLAKRRLLQHEDLWKLPEGDQAAVISERFSSAWTAAEATLRARKGNIPMGPLSKEDREAVFVMATRRFLGASFFVLTPLVKLLNSTLQFSFPVLISGCLSFLEGRPPFGVLPLDAGIGFGLAGALFGVMVLRATAENTYFFLCMRAGWQLRAAVATSVFTKSLRLSASARQQRTLGEMLNLMQVDATKLEMFCHQFHSLWDGLYQIAGYVAILTQLLGWTSVLGVAVMIFAIPFQFRIMSKIGKAEGGIAKVTDGRVKSVNEAMQSMANVKMYHWESRLSGVIGEHRATEIGMRRNQQRLFAFSRSYMMAVPTFVAIAAFSGYALVNEGNVRASVLFAALAAFNQLRFPLMFYPMALMSYMQARVSRARVASLLAMPETVAKQQEPDAGAGGSSGGGAAKGLSIRGGEFWWAEPKEGAQGGEVEAPETLSAGTTDGKPTPGAKAEKKATTKKGKKGKKVESATSTGGGEGKANMDKEASDDAAFRPTLRDIDVEVREGELVAVVGSTGSGKSSLVCAMLGEMVQTKGTPVNATRQGLSVSYAAQTPWILNETIRNNILFGEPWDAERYAQVLSVCQLGPDLDSLPDGDSTEIGEKGITLSGGQKQRVAIARAAYGRRELVFLDDVLSALDPEVASGVFERCIIDFLGGTTRVLVTNRLDLCSRCDRVVLLELDSAGVGAVTQTGTHSELLEKGGAYAKLLHDAELGKQAGGSTEQKGDADGAAGLTAKEGAAGQSGVLAEKKGAAGQAAAAGGGGGTRKALMQTEERGEGAIKVDVYGEYIRRGGGKGILVAILSLHVLCTIVMLGSTLWVGFWTADATPIVNVTAGYSVMPFPAWLSGYAALGVLVACLTFARTFGFAVFCLRAARGLHNGLVGAVMHAPLSFFDTTPIGRIVSRFSKDMYAIDHEMLDQVDMFVFMLVWLFATLGSIIAATPWFAVALPPLGAVYIYFVRFFRPVARECKRLESLARSPVFAHYSETLGGIPTIRAYAAEKRFAAANQKLVDALNEAYYVNKIAVCDCILTPPLHPSPPYPYPSPPCPYPCPPPYRTAGSRSVSSSSAPRSCCSRRRSRCSTLCSRARTARARIRCTRALPALPSSVRRA
jgi:ATP-binding cassette subfamily C (CFTR/MRP) protein 1